MICRLEIPCFFTNKILINTLGGKLKKGHSWNSSKLLPTDIIRKSFQDYTSLNIKKKKKSPERVNQCTHTGRHTFTPIRDGSFPCARHNDSGPLTPLEGRRRKCCVFGRTILLLRTSWRRTAYFFFCLDCSFHLFCVKLLGDDPETTGQ